MWFGPDSTDIEKKLSVKAAQVGVLAARVGVLAAPPTNSSLEPLHKEILFARFPVPLCKHLLFWPRCCEIETLCVLSL